MDIKDLHLDNVDKVLYAINPDPDHSVSNRYRGDRSLAHAINPCDWALLRRVLQTSATTLTSLNFDWLFINSAEDPLNSFDRSSEMFLELFQLRLPNLKVFQVRNAAIASETDLPAGLYLLDSCRRDTEEVRCFPPDLCLDFMQAHPHLECLAWPMDRFYQPIEGPISQRSQEITAKLATTLTELRVDHYFSQFGEAQTDDDNRVLQPSQMPFKQSRRRFILHFASKMRNIKTLKMEGGIPHDEKNQTIIALNACPLEKVVLIGTSWPIGNTWGSDVADEDWAQFLEEEDLGLIARVGMEDPKPPGPDWTFSPEYGKDARCHTIQKIASHHGDTIKELKLCGYQGCPTLWESSSIAPFFLRPLKHLHNLQTLVASLWLQTWYEDGPRDRQIIEYWFAARSPSTTALTAPNDEEPNAWAVTLKTKFEASRIAQRIADLFAPWLSPRAKGRNGGVHIRGNFCVGESADIFDFDVWVGKLADGADGVLEWRGPTSELDRTREKLRNRAWFG